MKNSNLTNFVVIVFDRQNIESDGLVGLCFSYTFYSFSPALGIPANPRNGLANKLAWQIQILTYVDSAQKYQSNCFMSVEN